ncbi:hypothetical protein KA089_01570 [Candidatus Woesebacteria bacterium]|nr:hypothetical protein [Candidatus Woesebacteria bacterium]
MQETDQPQPQDAIKYTADNPFDLPVGTINNFMSELFKITSMSKETVHFNWHQAIFTISDRGVVEPIDKANVKADDYRIKDLQEAADAIWKK